MMSGPRVEKFTEGWAVFVFGFGKAHYFKRIEAGACIPICGSTARPAGYLLERGDWTKCRTCEQRLAKTRGKA